MFRDNEGRMLLAYVGNLGKVSNNVVEAMALLWGLKLVINVGWENVEIEGDLKMIIEIVKGNMKEGWVIKGVIEEIRPLLIILKRFEIQHIFREDNGVADKVVTLGLRVHDLRC